MADIPNLAGVATQELVESIGTGSFKASYINWSRTMQMLRDHAPGWMVELVQNRDGGYIHRAPVGGYLLIRFRHADGTETTALPQSIMDHKNKAIPFDLIDARDITDTHRRGACMAAAFTFGLAYELWAKMPLESGYAQEEAKPEKLARKSLSPGNQKAWEAAKARYAKDGKLDAVREHMDVSQEVEAELIAEVKRERDAVA